MRFEGLSRCLWDCSNKKSIHSFMDPSELGLASLLETCIFVSTKTLISYLARE